MARAYEDCYPDLAWALARIPHEAKAYEVRQNYLDGKHQLHFASDKFLTAFAGLFQAFALNLCPAIVNAVNDRLDVEAWEGVGAKDAEDLWAANRMPLLSVQVHDEALGLGDAYVIVWPDDDEDGGGVRIFPQDPRACAVRYDEEDPTEIDMGAKLWCVMGMPDPDKEDHTQGRCVWRCNLYYDDTVVKYTTTELAHDAKLPKASAWLPFQDEMGEEGGPVIDNSWGVVPMFHFAPSAKVGHPGKSAIRDVIPIQDALNKTVSDMLVGSEFTALPQRWATGVEPDDEEPAQTGSPEKPRFRPGVDRVWTLEANDARFGEFPAANLTGFIEIADFFKVSAAQVTGTPSHYMMLMGAEYPSGESQKTSEARLVKQCERHQTGFGFVWGDVLRCGLKMSGKSGGDDLLPIWDSAETRNDLAEAQTAVTKKGVGVTDQQNLKELGYTPEEIDEMMAIKVENARTFGLAQVQAFNAGKGAAPASGAPGMPPPMGQPPTKPKPPAPGKPKLPPAATGG